VNSDLYLNTRELKPGDVLLTRGPGKKPSKVIATATGGPYSHAALIVNFASMFESEDMGVGYTLLRIHRVEETKNGPRFLSCLEGIEEAEIRRHPHFQNDKEHDAFLEETLHRALLPFYGKQYPEWANLADALGGGPKTAIARLVLAIKDRIENEKLINQGPFCSQLVAAAFSKMFLGQRIPCSYQRCKRRM